MWIWQRSCNLVNMWDSVSISSKGSGYQWFSPSSIQKSAAPLSGLVWLLLCGNVSDAVAPLASIISPARSFSWSPACQIAFQSVKTLLLCSVYVFLAAPNFTQPFELEVDARACGDVLLQEDNWSPHLLLFKKKFDQHQLNFSTIEEEALALLGSTSQPVHRS